MPGQYTPLPQGASPRRSMSFGRLGSHSRRQSTIPDPNEMDQAFDGPGDDDDHDDATESHNLLGNNTPPSNSRSTAMPGDYDFDRDYFLPPPGSPPPFEPYSASNPAPGNSNGTVPTDDNIRRPQPNRHFLGGILPLSILPRSYQVPSNAIGGGQSGVFANLSARPDGVHNGDTQEDGPEFANEDERKDAPPSYQTALRDAVPPYWDTTVVLPSSSSPFGPLSSSVNGDEILIDGMPAGNFFGFLWNLVVSFVFQFVGFLLTYVLHTTHAAKHGSRTGLGITLVTVGLSLRRKAEVLIDTGRYPGQSEIVDPKTGKMQGDIDGEQQLAAFGGTFDWSKPVRIPDSWGGHGETFTVSNVNDLIEVAHQYNRTLSDWIQPPAVDVGRANEWFAFMMMTMGWFIILASVGSWWRIKRFEAKLKAAERQSQAAQAAARGELDGLDEEEPTGRVEPGPRELAYYTAAFTQAVNGVREIQQGFFGRRGRPVAGHGDTLFNQDDDENDLLAAQGYGLEPMANDAPGAAAARARGLWSR